MSSQPGHAGHMDHPVQLVAPGIPGYELGRAHGQVAAHVQDLHDSIAVGLYPDHAVQADPSLVGCGASVLVGEWLRATVL